jgi:glycosyltransferase involved in cell wall biosynthesis
MAHRLPCLFSDLPVHKEITSDGDAAMLFATGDASSLREKLIFLLKDESLRHSYAEKAYRTIQTRFSAAVAERAYAHEFEI